MTPLVWFALTLLTTAIMSFFSTQEMACVSFNKLRLEYLVSQGRKRALWLNAMLKTPTHLFGTTLIGVNLFLMISSECARQLYGSLGVSQELSAITQAPFILIMGELAPMFAARWCAEKVALWGSPIVYFSSLLLTPILKAIDMLSDAVNRILDNKHVDRTEEILIREELQKFLEQKDDGGHSISNEGLDDAIIANIFNLRLKRAFQIMQPLSNLKTVSSRSTVLEVRKTLKFTDQDFVPIWHRTPLQIVGIAFLQDIVRLTDNKRILDARSSCWFVTEVTPLLKLIDEFRRHKQPVAIVLNDKAEAVGVVTFDDIMEEILFKGVPPVDKIKMDQPQIYFHEKSLPGDLPIETLNRSFGLNWQEEDCVTLADLVERKLGHHPNVGDSITLDPYELVVKETSLLGAKTISIRSKRWS